MADEIIKDFIFNTEIEGNRNYEIIPKNIYDFLANGAQNKKIPDYQRPYSWQKEHVEAFLNDIFEIWLNLNGKKSWFLGSIYITKSSNSDKECQILDGQQRITTIQLILTELYLSQFYDKSINFKTNNFKKLQRAILDCLLINKSGDYVPKFSSDLVTNVYLKEYITDSMNIETYEGYKIFYEDFVSKLDEASRTSFSIISLKKNIGYIRTFIIKNIFQNVENPEILGIEEIPERIYNFASTLLYKFWLIEIPLVRESISVEIFEGLNNRGKPLSLLDKIQFRSLTKGFSDLIKIKIEWKELYILIDELQNTLNYKLFKDDEDFLKNFILSIKGKELDGEDGYLEEFESNFLKDQETLFDFFIDVKRIIKFFIGLGNLDNFQFLENFKNEKNVVNKEEYYQAKAVLAYLNLFIRNYKNTVYLVINLLYNLKDEKKQNYLIMNGIWSILQISFYKNILEGQGPNDIRKDWNLFISKYSNDLNSYLNIIFYLNNIKKTYEVLELENNSDSNSNKSENTIPSLFKFNNLIFSEDKKSFKYEFKKSLDSNSSFLNTTDNDKAALVLYLYVLLTNYKNILAYSKIEHSSKNLEHIFPRAWKSNWSDKKYSKDEVLNYLQNIERSSLFSAVKNSEEFELKDYVSSPFVIDSEETLIEWIGNKLILNKNKNSSISNYNYKTKYEKGYSGTGHIVLPNIKSDKLFLNDKTDFNYKVIIDRSIEILDEISINFFSIHWNALK